MVVQQERKRFNTRRGYIKEAPLLLMESAAPLQKQSILWVSLAHKNQASHYF